MLTVADKPFPSIPVTRPLMLWDTSTVGGVYMMSVDDEKGDIYIGVTFYSEANGTMYRFDRNGNFVEKFDCGGQNPKTMAFID